VSSIRNLSKFFSTHPLTREAPFGAWARFVAWQIRSRVQKDIIFHWIEGQCLAVRRGMNGATGNIYVGLHEFADMMLPLHFLRETDLFFDIGANIGTYSILAAGVRGAEVWAFEPDPQTALSLKRNIHLNGLQGRVKIHEMAIGDYDGVMTFTLGLDTMNRIATSIDDQVQTVQVRRIDGLISDRWPIMIKLDVEGHEEAAIRGAKALFANDSLKVVELETVTEEIENTLEQYGFSQAFYDPFSRLLTSSETLHGASNAVYVRDWDFVAARLAAAPNVRVLGKSI
jgi:FkbM family methyltransferase